MVCAGVRITRTGEEWAPSPGVTCSPAGTHGLHGKPVRWLRAETVSGGSSARRVNVVIDRGRRCRHRGLFPFFLHLDTLAKSVTPQGMSSSAQHPRPILLSGRTCLLRHTWMHTHARSCVHACPRAHAHTRGIWTPLVACVPLGGGFLGAPSSSTRSLPLGFQGREPRSWTVIRLTWWRKCLLKWSWWVIRLRCLLLTRVDGLRAV